MEKKKKIIGVMNLMIVLLAEKFIVNPYKVEGEKIPSDLDFFRTLQQSNEFNDFGLRKISLFPFLLFMTRGKSGKDLWLDFFTDLENDFYFIPGEDGVINPGINSLLESGDENLYFESRIFTSKLKLDKLREFRTKEAFEQHILNEFFEGNDENQILSKIIYSIEYMHDKRKPTFANLYFDTLKHFSRDSLSYRTYSKNKGKDDVFNFYSIVKAESFCFAMQTVL
ncbi:MAG: hypothetical protein WCO35_00925 [Candidatus Nomurabacteria bacterium]